MMDLDNHANMVVIGRNSIVLRETRWYTKVAPFILDYESLHYALIVNSCAEYNNDYSGETFLFVFYNTLCVLAIDYNLFPPFIISKARIEIKTIP